MSRTDFAGMAPLHRWLFLAAVLGSLAVGITEMFDPAWKPLIQIVAGGLHMTLAAIVGFDVGRIATQYSEYRRRTVGGEQPYDSVAGVRITYAVVFGGFGVLLILLGVWNILG
jgi:hypothetical protein